MQQKRLLHTVEPIISQRILEKPWSLHKGNHCTSLNFLYSLISELILYLIFDSESKWSFIFRTRLRKQKSRSYSYLNFEIRFKTHVAREQPYYIQQNLSQGQACQEKSSWSLHKGNHCNTLEWWFAKFSQFPDGKIDFIFDSRLRIKVELHIQNQSTKLNNFILI